MGRAVLLLERNRSEMETRGKWDPVLGLVTLAIMAFVVIGILLMTGVFNPNNAAEPLNTELKQISPRKST